MSDEVENTKENPLVESLLPTTNEDEMKKYTGQAVPLLKRQRERNKVAEISNSGA